MMEVSHNVSVCPLNDEELADAATASPGSTGLDPKCFASMEILQRLLFLSDVPSLYRLSWLQFERCGSISNLD